MHLDELAERVRKAGVPTVAEATGIKPSKLSRFVNNPLKITIREVQQVEAALAKIGA